MYRGERESLERSAIRPAAQVRVKPVTSAGSWVPRAGRASRGPRCSPAWDRPPPRTHASLPCWASADSGPGSLASRMAYGPFEPPGLVAGSPWDLIRLTTGLSPGTPATTFLGKRPRRRAGPTTIQTEASGSLVETASCASRSALRACRVGHGGPAREHHSVAGFRRWSSPHRSADRPHGSGSGQLQATNAVAADAEASQLQGRAAGVGQEC